MPPNLKCAQDRINIGLGKCKLICEQKDLEEKNLQEAGGFHVVADFLVEKQRQGQWLGWGKARWKWWSPSVVPHLHPFGLSKILQNLWNWAILQETFRASKALWKSCQIGEHEQDNLKTQNRHPEGDSVPGDIIVTNRHSSEEKMSLEIL
ncbi:3335_t:CDS:2 [Acaulospora colombiana]|uniref:3335_t:CDS:1 n=1 Tax=Acaulospora colombiana TaxID=27376 RepID=A0ACA9M8L1_9GLOM|nr:3335_t:CDS:2 [Acaulospora colombiana]